jgi:hypothetical protein
LCEGPRTAYATLMRLIVAWHDIRGHLPLWREARRCFSRRMRPLRRTRCTRPQERTCRSAYSLCSLSATAPGFFVISSERSKKITAESPSFLFCFRTAVTMHDRVVIFYGIHDATPWRGIGLHGVASAATAGRRPQATAWHLPRRGIGSVDTWIPRCDNDLSINF